MEGLIEGCIVHTVLNDEFGECEGKHRASIVTEVLDPASGTIYAEVFLTPKDRIVSNKHRIYSMLLKYSEDKEPGTWHWIEKA
jgi:hypothetical protein